MFGVIHNISLVPGEWYYFSVDSYASAAGTFTISIKDHVGFDLKAKAELLTSISSWTSSDGAYSNVGASRNQDGNGACGAANGDVWFKFQATTSEVELKVLSGGTKGTSAGYYISLYNQAGNSIGCGQSNNVTANNIMFGIIHNISLVPGEWYYFSVDSYASAAGTFTISIKDQVGFDLKAKAELLTSISSWTSSDGAYSNVGASRNEDGNGACGAANGDVWFKFQATTSEVELKVLSGGTKGTSAGYYISSVIYLRCPEQLKLKKKGLILEK